MDDFLPATRPRVFVQHELNALLAEDAHRPEGPNIGAAGQHLTISFLSFNRAALSERLCRSIAECIPQFAGEVLVIDNGSDPQELERVRAVLAAMPYRSRVVELDKNHGVGGGRNHTARHARTEWLMCVDNDLYFIANPLAEVQRDLAELGCRFMSLPLLEPDGEKLFARGGLLHLWTDADGNVCIGGGSATPVDRLGVRPLPGFLASFLYGGSSVCHVETFKAVGGYDERCFIGYEDTDLSIRLFRRGYKVGVTGAVALIHDHAKPASDADKQSDEVRFDIDVISESARHLNNKYGFKFWTAGDDEWLRQRRQILGLKAVGTTGERAPAAASGRPRIALVTEVDNWAFANIASQISKHLSSRYDFELIPASDLDGNYARLLLTLRDFDLIHFFWRKIYSDLFSEWIDGYFRSIGHDAGELRRDILSRAAVTTSVYDHLELDPDSVARRRPLFNSVTGYAVSSERLRAIYSAIGSYPPPSAVTLDGVDLGLFKPAHLERFDDLDRRPFVIGWAGNSDWTSHIEDFKGVHSILKPVASRLKADGIADLLLADRQETHWPFKKMPSYYGMIDVYVCTSKIEGTPNPVLEAMACGVPVISTDVGIVPELFGPLQRRFILRERSQQALTDALLELHRDRSLFKKLSAENIASIQAWDWSNKVAAFDRFFQTMLERHRSMPPIDRSSLA